MSLGGYQSITFIRYCTWSIPRPLRPPTRTRTPQAPPPQTRAGWLDVERGSWRWTPCHPPPPAVSQDYPFCSSSRHHNCQLCYFLTLTAKMRKIRKLNNELIYTITWCAEWLPRDLTEGWALLGRAIADLCWFKMATYNLTRTNLCYSHKMAFDWIADQLIIDGLIQLQWWLVDDNTVSGSYLVVRGLITAGRKIQAAPVLLQPFLFVPFLPLVTL